MGRNDRPHVRRQEESTAFIAGGQTLLDRMLARGFDVAATYTLLYNGSLLVEAGMGVAICFDGIVTAGEGTPFAFVPLTDVSTTPAWLVWKRYVPLSRASYYTQERGLMAEESALDVMRRYGVVPEAWAPLGGGRYNPFAEPDFLTIAEAHGKTVGQVILRWNVQRGVVVIPKSTHTERIAENFDIWDFELSADEMATISGHDMGYSGSRAKHFEPSFVRMCLGKE